MRIERVYLVDDSRRFNPESACPISRTDTSKPDQERTVDDGKEGVTIRTIFFAAGTMLPLFLWDQES